MRKDILVRDRALEAVQKLRRQIVEPGLCARHRRRPQDFSRECRLTFSVLVILLLQKSLKSLQARLHEYMWQLLGCPEQGGLSVGAVTHARAKLSAEVFVELNHEAILPTVYGEQNQELVERWRGHRVLAVDSSLIRLPKSQAVAKKYGWSQTTPEALVQERYPQGRMSVLYDLLNELALDAKLAPWKEQEEQMGRWQLEKVQSGDVIITDRGYTSYKWLWTAVAKGAHVISRCSGSSFGLARTLLQKNRAGLSVTATLGIGKESKTAVLKQGWPLELRVRFVTVRLKTGELEVLVTTLLDEKAYPTEELAQLYWRRWGQETFFARLKSRMDLENCSGLTVDAVEQDFAATVLLSNVESVVIGPASHELAERTQGREQPTKVNRAVSIHALKTRLIDLLASDLPAEKVLDELTNWFQHSPVSVRKRRQVPRLKRSTARSYHFQRHEKKIVF